MSRPESSGVVVRYEGLQDKYIPCLILADVDHKQDAIQVAETIKCRTHVALIGTTQRPEFFRAVDRIIGLERASDESAYLRFVTVGAQPHDLRLHLRAGLEVTNNLAVYFPDIESRIQLEFVARFGERELASR